MPQSMVLPLSNEYPQLSHPPLREALVDIKLRDALSVDWVRDLERITFGGFDTSQAIKQGAFRFEIPKDDQPAQAKVTSEQLFGRRYDRADESRVLQVRRNGMTLSILKNYTRWEDLKDTTRLLWDEYVRIVGTTVIVDRLAVRYINAIEIPPGDDCDKYLTAAPRIPAELPQMLTNFMQRVEIPFLEKEATAIITQTLGNVPPWGSATGALILDIDVFQSCSLAVTSSEIWARLDNLRDIANRVFFSSVTREALNSYL